MHEEGYTLHFSRGKRPYFLDPNMKLLPDVPPPPRPPEPVEALLHQNRARAVEPGPLTSTARYKREENIPTAVVMRALRALEAVALDEVAPEEVARDEVAPEGSALDESALEESPFVS